jgi:RHS repeat-associated protein
VDANGAVVAHREFDAFGNTTAATGTLVHQLHFWFSTKYLDEETANYVYQQRQAVPSLGRWASRDPIGEKGGINLFCMILSDLINRTDYLGLLLNLKDLPNTCGKCKVYWVERSGERGLTAQPAQWLTGTMNYTPCGGGTGRNDPPRFKRSYTGESCVTRIYTDVDPQSPSGIKGVTYAQHEMKHVKCGADAYEWMLKELASKVLGSCCCMSAWSENGDVLERLIRLAAEDMRQACTYKVDADDYPNSTNKEERENAPTKQMHSDGALKRLQEKIAEIERRAKKWATCQ